MGRSRWTLSFRCAECSEFGDASTTAEENELYRTWKVTRGGNTCPDCLDAWHEAGRPKAVRKRKQADPTPHVHGQKQIDLFGNVTEMPDSRSKPRI